MLNGFIIRAEKFIYCGVGLIANPNIRIIKLFLFQREEISTKDKKQICCGEILVIIRDELKAEYGQELTLAVQLQRPFGEYLRRQGIYLIARVKTRDFVHWTGKNKGWPIKRQILRVKARIELKFENSLTPLCAGIIEAMTLGEERNIPAVVYKNMIKSGTVHILPRLYTKMPSIAL